MGVAKRTENCFRRSQAADMSSHINLFFQWQAISRVTILGGHMLLYHQR